MTSSVANTKDLFSKDPKRVVSIGIEGSANKVGGMILTCLIQPKYFKFNLKIIINIFNNQVGIISFLETTDTYEILSNPRKTYIAPAG